METKLEITIESEEEKITFEPAEMMNIEKIHLWLSSIMVECWSYDFEEMRKRHLKCTTITSPMDLRSPGRCCQSEKGTVRLEVNDTFQLCRSKPRLAGTSPQERKKLHWSDSRQSQ